MIESSDVRLRRLRLRAWRRGIREMDLILGGFADSALATLDPAALDLFEALLGEDDHDLYAWVSGAAAPPARFVPMIARLREAVPAPKGA